MEGALAACVRSLWGVTSGLPGVGEDPSAALLCASAHPAQMLRLPNKGCLRPGSDADIVLLDEVRTHRRTPPCPEPKCRHVAARAFDSRYFATVTSTSLLHHRYIHAPLPVAPQALNVRATFVDGALAWQHPDMRGALWFHN